jgi:hypothetical protein
MEQKYYYHSGLNVVSNLDIPEWAAFECFKPFPQPDVTIAVNHCPFTDMDIKRSNAPQFDSSAVLDKAPVTPQAPSCEEYYFQIPDVGNYRIKKGNEIIVTPFPSASWREIRLFLLGSAWGALCYQRGLLVLHASAIRVNNGVAAFCAPPKHGKSSLVAWLTERGYPFISDDLCRIDPFAPEGPVIFPSTPKLKLCRDTLETLEWRYDKMEKDHFRTDKYHHPMPYQGITPLPLREIYLLKWGNLSINKLLGADSLRGLVSNATYRAEFLDPIGFLGAYWTHCMALTQSVTVWEFIRPLDISLMDQTVDILIANLHGKNNSK